MKYIYADLNNGCMEIKKEDAEIPVNFCSDIDDARSHLDKLSTDVFEIVIQVSNDVFDIINKEYGIKRVN